MFYTVLLVNRAMCQKKKEAWGLVLQDAVAAISIDSHLMKVLLNVDMSECICNWN